ncbi:hypothetical protein QFZ35_003206 [Arthrobacter ulcerisalmonis]|nr:hypothetical protein [Arthrobacter ulcerisalmonis]
MTSVDDRIEHGEQSDGPADENSAPSREEIFAAFDKIASSSGPGHDRRPDLVFLEKIRKYK